MKSIIILVVFMGCWIVLQRYILPKMGIST